MEVRTQSRLGVGVWGQMARMWSGEGSAESGVIVMAGGIGGIGGVVSWLSGWRGGLLVPVPVVVVVKEVVRNEAVFTVLSKSGSGGNWECRRVSWNRRECCTKASSSSFSVLVAAKNDVSSSGPSKDCPGSGTEKGISGPLEYIPPWGRWG